MLDGNSADIPTAVKIKQSVFVQIPGFNHTRIPTGGALINPLGQANFHPARFDITGPDNASYMVDLPSDVTQVRDLSGDPSAKLDVINIEGYSVGLPGLVNPNGKIGGDGTDVLFVTGTLVVTTIAEKGRYRGTISVTITIE